MFCLIFFLGHSVLVRELVVRLCIIKTEINSNVFTLFYVFF